MPRMPGEAARGCNAAYRAKNQGGVIAGEQARVEARGEATWRWTPSSPRPLVHRHRTTYPVCMKNVTLSVDEATLARVRKYAAERETSVNALVREFLGSIAAREDRGRQARKRILEMSRSSTARLGRKTWTRDDLHER